MIVYRVTGGAQPIEYLHYRYALVRARIDAAREGRDFQIWRVVEDGPAYPVPVLVTIVSCG